MIPTTDTTVTFWHWFGLWENDFLMILDAILVAIFATALVVKLRGTSLRLSVLLADQIKVRWAIGLFFVSRWINRFADFLAARNLDTAETHKLIDSAALFLAVWSALCLVRVFAVVAWGRKTWLWATALAALGSTLLSYFLV